jgi:hypothetical protein
MEVTIHQVRAALYPDEPNYVEASKLGQAAVEHLISIIQRQEPGLEIKAIYLASLIHDRKLEAVIKEAAFSPRSEIRLVAAMATRNLNADLRNELLERLLKDNDIGVCKTALQSTRGKVTTVLSRQIETLQKEHPDRTIRHLASEILEQQK